MKVLGRAMRSFGIDESAVYFVQNMYANIKSLVRVNDLDSEELDMIVRVHQDYYILIPLLFIMVPEAL